jgi:hypothetical protein
MEGRGGGEPQGVADPPPHKKTATITTTKTINNFFRHPSRSRAARPTARTSGFVSLAADAERPWPPVDGGGRGRALEQYQVCGVRNVVLQEPILRLLNLHTQRCSRLECSCI